MGTKVIQAVYENGVLKPMQRLELTEQQVVQIGINPEETTEHPYITQTLGICGGRPVIKGTRIPVKVLIQYHRMGDTMEKILAGFPGLTPAQFYDALSYYYDHSAEIDADIEADELSHLVQRFNLQLGADGILSLQGD
ncbi:MAG: DUF433 domain-containing protein [Scytonema sp. PMC 1069.18]|nr:DUF433 domain-containing protein [Scytonema sp. PMC 1069.18]MEC4882902.1 DUF433 domain-containing protein [Scytonema sp. PMC 1070.18]